MVGVVTELDLLKAVEEGRELVKTTAEEIMHTEVITADVDTPVSELLKLMTDKNIICLPITQGPTGRGSGPLRYIEGPDRA